MHFLHARHMDLHRSTTRSLGWKPRTLTLEEFTLPLNCWAWSPKSIFTITMVEHSIKMVFLCNGLARSKYSELLVSEMKEHLRGWFSKERGAARRNWGPQHRHPETLLPPQTGTRWEGERGEAGKSEQNPRH